jgi:hypothetical protein
VKSNGRTSVLVVLVVLACSFIDTQAKSAPAPTNWKPNSRQRQPFSLSEDQISSHLVPRRDSPNPSSYGAPQSSGDEPVDLHNKEFCVDVSTFEPVVWEEKDGEECSTIFVKRCEDKQENICEDVTETKCEVQPYTECSMGLEPQEFSETKLEPKQFTEKVCETGKKVIPHTKMLPQCKNVTKQNCVTLWETDENGKQQWAGNEACEPVTWQECKLVPKTVSFIVPEIKCEDGQSIWYHEPTPKTDTRMTNTFDCVVKKTTNCRTEVRPDCKQVQYQTCREIPVTNCKSKKVHVPTQEKLHRKKCLLPDEASQSGPAPDNYGVPRAEPVSQYSAAPAPAPQYAPQPAPQYSQSG